MRFKATTRYWLSVSLAIVALLLAVSAFLLWVIFPHGYFPSRVIWVGIHKWAGLAITVGVLFHIGLHWKWLIRMTLHYIHRLRR